MAIDDKLNDPLATTGKIPSVPQALGQFQDVAREQRASIERTGELEAEKLARKPQIESELLQAQKQYRDVEKKKYEQEVGIAEQDMANFKVSQDSIAGMSGLGTAILMMGQLLGKTGGQQSAMGAIQGMTGMMQGYTQGRADEFKRGQIEFDRNFKMLQERIKRANDKFQAALAEMPYNTIEAQTKAAQALAELDSPILKEQYKQQGLVITANTVSKVLDASQQAANRANQLAIAAAKGAGKGGGAGAIQFRYNGAVASASDKLSIHISNLTSAPLASEPPAFGEIITDPKKITTGFIQYLGAQITDPENRAMQQQLAAIIPEIANVEAAGRPGGATEARISELHKIAPVAGDSKINYYMFLALAKQELKIAKTTLEVSGGTPEQIAVAQRSIDKVDKIIPYEVEDINRILRGPQGAMLLNDKVNNMLKTSNSLQTFDNAVQSQIDKTVPRSTSSGTTVSNWD